MVTRRKNKFETTIWQDVKSWAKFSFGDAKAFSDFVGFHVRAFFCLTLALVAIFPSVDVWIQSEAAQIPYVTPYSSLEGILQVAAFALFAAFFLLLIINIFRSVWYSLVSRPFRTGKSAFRWLAVIMGLPATLLIWTLEVAAFMAIIYRVFFTLLFALIATDAERAELNEKLCIILPFAEKTGLPIVPKPDCNDTDDTQPKRNSP